MIKTFDFNSLEQPILETTLMDAARTKVRLTVPTEELYERFIALSKEVETLTKNPTGYIIRKVYELWAEIFSCNADGVTYTAEDLRDRYGIKLMHLICFQPAYLSFLNDVQSAKN